ncbi:MAG: PEP-CTERM sorting domain-containing protein [Planctomycetota bacterium]
MGIQTSIVALAAVASAATASFDIQVTEMWMGNEPGANLTEDWFEVTNFGTSDFTFGVDGYLFFDDNSADPSVADLMQGIGTIAAGETVVFVDEGSGGALGFFNTWYPGGGTPGAGGIPQIGFYDGSGLGQGGDAVALFLGATDNFEDLVAGDLIDLESYPDADANGGQSWDVVLGGFSTVGNASGAFSTALANDEGQFAIASPGTIPTPGALAIIGLGGLAAARRRR